MQSYVPSAIRRTPTEAGFLPDHSMSVVSRLKLIFPAVIVADLAACSAAPTVASSGPATLPVPRAAIYVAYMDTVSAVKSADITVTPQGGWFTLGKTGVYFPANAICDPAKSSYGPTEWDTNCTVIRK